MSDLCSISDDKFKRTKCGEIITIDQVGYMGPVDRESTEYSPWVDFETVCKTCERKKHELSD